MIKSVKIALVITLVLLIILTTLYISLPKPLLIGDVNGDGKINEVDIKYIQEYLLEIRELSDDEKVRADMNQDGKISVLDMLQIQRYILAMEEQ